MLQATDGDLGSTSPGMLPRANNSRTPLVLVQGGKDHILRLVDRAPLPGVGGELQRVELPKPLFATPAIYTEPSGRAWVYVVMRDDVRAYRYGVDDRGQSRLIGEWIAHPGDSTGEGSSPVVSNGIVFVAVDDAIVALDGRTGGFLWSSRLRSAGRTIGAVHWQSPIVVDGAVYCSDESGKLTAYALR
jgi:PQQ-like domain